MKEYLIDIARCSVYLSEIMETEERKKRVKHHLIDLGISFREWCRREEVSHSVARDLIYGRLDGSRAEKTLQVKGIIEKEFGKNIFS